MFLDTNSSSGSHELFLLEKNTAVPDRKPCQISKVELYTKMVNDILPLIILTKSTILDAWLVYKCAFD